MFTIHIDMHLHYVPPMSRMGRAIVMTHQVMLPFAPSNDQAIFVPAIDRCKEPMGFCLKEVVYDAERGVFLANTFAEDIDFPIRFVPDELAEWVRLGWRFGSYRDSYVRKADEESDETDDETRVDGPDEWELAEAERLCSWRGRDSAGNRAYKAMIRHLVDAYGVEEDAYAFDITGRYFTTSELQDKTSNPQHTEKYFAAQKAYIDMPEPARRAWRARIRRYPTLEKVTRERLKEQQAAGTGQKDEVITMQP